MAVIDMTASVTGAAPPCQMHLSYRLHRIDSQEERERRETFLKHLKSKVSARAGNEVVDGREVAAKTGLPGGWVFNAAESQLLDHCYPNRHFRLETDGGHDIIVPPTFGLEPVDL
jgi:hypothetical protein